MHNLIPIHCITPFCSDAPALSALVFTLQRQRQSFHRNIELKTSKHEFPDKIHQNKQGFEGKKLSEGQARRNSLRFNNMCCRLHIGTQRLLMFSYLDFRVFFCLLSSNILKINCLTCIWSKFVDTSFHPSQNPQQNSSRRHRHFYQI